MVRTILSYPSMAVVWLMRPFKLWAWRTRFRIVNRLVVTITKPIDFLLIWLNTQNGAMLLCRRAYGGNFIFGDAYMVTDFETTDASIRELSSRGENFMGVSIVSSEADVFASGSGILSQSEPLRSCTRKYLDDNVFTPPVHCLTLPRVKERCATLLGEWRADPDRNKMLTVRSAVTRIFILLLSGTKLDYDLSKRVTRSYVRSFVELSLFGRYFVFLSDLLGSRQRLRREVYFPLKQLGIDTMISDVTMFAAMFSVGTMVLRAVEDAKKFDIDYASLDELGKRRFLVEVVRLFPTVTTVHRLVENDTEVDLLGRRVVLRPGSEIAYPFVCSNRDPEHFPGPDDLRLDRTEEEYEKVLSWSKGPHACPAKELALLVGAMMLETMSEEDDLRSYSIFNPMF